MPQALIPLGLGAIGAFAGSGKQGGKEATSSGTASTQTNQDINSNFNTTQNGSVNTGAATQNTEDPLTKLFRGNLFGSVGQEIQRAQAPVYGDAQKASFLNNLNDLGDASFKSLTSNLSRRGALNSGNFVEGADAIDTAKFSNLSSFYSALPFQEATARTARLTPLLNNATTLAGHAPVDTNVTGTQQSATTGGGTSYQQTLGNSNTQSQSKTSQSDIGPSFLKALFSQLGDLGATNLEGLKKALGGIFGGGGGAGIADGGD